MSPKVQKYIEILKEGMEAYRSSGNHIHRQAELDALWYEFDEDESREAEEEYFRIKEMNRKQS